jgi:Ca-activated chloride channel family protein
VKVMPMPAPPPATLADSLVQEEPRPAFNTEAYDHIVDNAFLAAAESPLSTFSIDVDTASYANVRRFLRDGRMPPKDAVRIEELLNYFRYDYPPAPADAPFSVTTEVGPCPWAAGHQLVLVGLQGRRLDPGRIPPRNLVFLVDVSGSMQDPRKLPLVKSALAMLAETLDEKDRVSIVVYAGASGLALPPTPGDRHGEIRATLGQLEAGGSTAGSEGIQLAYRVAAENFVAGGVNRVILATDGDFNVGVTSQGDLVRLIEEERGRGIFLSVLGFGMGNLKDSTMEKLADAGNGNYAYIDSLAEARKVLVTESAGTLVTIAKDVKVQVEFDPRRVEAYRLIGYENRLLADRDFNDDTKDAGDIGAGHAVTALYEVVARGTATSLRGVDPLKYQRPREAAASAPEGELMTVKLRYKEPDGQASRLLAVAVKDRPTGPSSNLALSAAVAGFGMVLRDSEHKGSLSYGQALELAREADRLRPDEYRRELATLVERAERLAQGSPRRDASGG